MMIAYVFIVTVISAFGQADSWKGETLKAIVLNQVIEFVPRGTEETADFTLVDIKFQGKNIKTFAANSLLSPEIVGAFKAIDSEYILYRSYMGQGGCGRGSLYVIRFMIDQSPGNYDKLSAVIVSPPLDDCLGDGVIFGVHLRNRSRSNQNAIYNYECILTVSGHELNLDTMNSWVPQKAQVTKQQKRN